MRCLGYFSLSRTIATKQAFLVPITGIQGSGGKTLCDPGSQDPNFLQLWLHEAPRYIICLGESEPLARGGWQQADPLTRALKDEPLIYFRAQV